MHFERYLDCFKSVKPGDLITDKGTLLACSVGGRVALKGFPHCQGAFLWFVVKERGKVGWSEGEKDAGVELPHTLKPLRALLNATNLGTVDQTVVGIHLGNDND